MDDKKKNLRDMEARRRETQGLLDTLLEKLGASLAARFDADGGAPLAAGGPGGGEGPEALWEEKKRLAGGIVRSAASIEDIEADLRRLGELEEEINRAEQRQGEAAKEIAGVYVDLGEQVLNEGGYPEFTAAYEEEKNDIFGKIDFQQKRLEELESRNEGFFGRIASGAKTLVARSLLSKNEAALEKLYRLAGEKFLARFEDPPLSEVGVSRDVPEGAGPLVETGLRLAKVLSDRKDETAGLRAERREAKALLEQKGDPSRRISELKAFIAATNDEIRKVHLRIGACVRGGGVWRDSLVSLYSESDAFLDEKITSLDESVRDTERRIAVIKTAIAIDDKQAEIASLKKAVLEKRRRITEEEAAIAGIEGQIAAAEQHINELQGGHGEG